MYLYDRRARLDIKPVQDLQSKLEALFSNKTLMDRAKAQLNQTAYAELVRSVLLLEKHLGLFVELESKYPKK